MTRPYMGDWVGVSGQGQGGFQTRHYGMAICGVVKTNSYQVLFTTL